MSWERWPNRWPSPNQFTYSAIRPPLAGLAEHMLSTLARNHPFVDGNKRTALVVSFTFLLLHSIVIAASKEERYLMFYDLAAGHISKEELALWFEKNSSPEPEL